MMQKLFDATTTAEAAALAAGADGTVFVNRGDANNPSVMGIYAIAPSGGSPGNESSMALGCTAMFDAGAALRVECEGRLAIPEQEAGRG